ncbi:uncharacterized protein N7498_000556 [Penicillium cinerascens]|uniref:Uncharacterized protein n=1 Tax=Penicillium cinerascens TaxID=70096 RepID=A0A9W9NEK4_9EURO|nr:uncharacterized protein N7498_000556 [Penicillium cinerascens]KAJ5218457.1 hypothetical protein N7498_000556 [Penicillium cinerascens]
MNLKIRIFAPRDSGNGSSPATTDTISFSVADETDTCEVSPAPSEFPSCRWEKEAIIENLGGESEKGSTHPDLRKLIPAFLEEVVKGPTAVFVSGPGDMVSDVRGYRGIVQHWSQGLERTGEASLRCQPRL